MAEYFETDRKFNELCMSNGWKPEYFYTSSGFGHCLKWECRGSLFVGGCKLVAVAEGATKKECEKIVRSEIYKQIVERGPGNPEIRPCDEQIVADIDRFLLGKGYKIDHTFVETEGGLFCTTTFTLGETKEIVLSAYPTREMCIASAKKDMMTIVRAAGEKSIKIPIIQTKYKPLEGIFCLNIIDTESVWPEKTIEFTGPVLYFWRTMTKREEISKYAEKIDTLLPFKLTREYSYCTVDYDGPEAVDHWISASVNTILKCAKDMGLEGITIASIDKSAKVTLSIFKKLIEAYQLKIDVELLGISCLQHQSEVRSQLVM